MSIFEPFESGSSEGWEGEGFLRSCGAGNDFALFHNCLSKTSKLQKTFTDLDDHTELNLRLNFHFLDKWEGEQAWVKVDDFVVWVKSRNWCSGIFANDCMTKGVDVCANSYPDLVGENVDVTVFHQKKSLKIEVGSTLKANDCSATWAIDNIIVSLR